MKSTFPPHRVAGAVLAGILALPMTACGFAFTQAPPGNHQSMNYFNCSQNRTGPVLDLVWAGLNLLGAVGAASGTDDGDPETSKSQVVTIGLVEGAIWGSSGIVGLNKVGKCRAAVQELVVRQNGAPRPPDSAGIVQRGAPLPAPFSRPSVVSLTRGDQHAVALFRAPSPPDSARPLSAVRRDSNGVRAPQ
jgi:hypothetical protein